MISKELQGQIDRLQKMGSFNLSMTLKTELQELLKDSSLPELTNLSCGTCLRKSMYDLIRLKNQQDSTPVLSMKKPITFDKKPIEMSYKELRAACKSKGIKTGRNPNTTKLIKLLS